MTSESKEGVNSDGRSIWNKILKIVSIGVLLYLVGFMIVVLRKHTMQEAFSLPEEIIYSFMFFFFGAYYTLIREEKCVQRIYSVLSTSWKKVARTFPSWSLLGLIWLVLLVIWAFLPPQVLNTDFLILNVVFSIINLVLYSLLFFIVFSSCVYSLTVYIPCGQHLASTKVKVEKKKEVADALTVLTPVLGFPWILAISFILFLVDIQIEPSWMNYILFISIYVTCFVIFIDLPYSVSIREKKQQDLDRLEKKRISVLEKLQRMGDDQTKAAMLKRIAFESEISRVDPEIQEIKSESLHPYKVVIPLASFLLGIFGVLFIDFIKELL